MESIKCKIYSEEEQRRICPESSPMIKFMQRKLSLTRHDESACLQHKRIRYALSECRWDSGKEIDISTLPSKLKHDGREDKAPDLIIEVEGYLIGVHSSILTNYSATLRRMCLNQSKQNENRNKKEPTVICLPCHSVEDLEELIRFAYFPDKEINDTNVLHALRLAETFGAEMLERRCEDYLISNEGYHPLDIIPVATRYNLKRLLAYSIQEASVIPRVQCYYDFEEIEFSIRLRILRLVEKRKIMYNNEEISKDDSGEGNFSFKERDDYDADYESE